MRFIGSLGLGIVMVGGPAIAAGHTSQTPSACEEETSTSQTAAPKETEEDTVSIIGDALEKLCISDEQRTAAEQLGKQVSPVHQQTVEARRALTDAIAAQLAAGSVDQSALKEKMDALAKAHEEQSPVVRKALEELHGILDKDQRNTLVDAIEARMQEHDANAAAKREEIGKELDLTADQKTQIKELFAKAKPRIEAARAKAKAVFEAFRGDEFSVDKIAPAADVAMQTRERVARMVTFATELACILTPGQRSALANRIAERRQGAQETENVGQSEQGLVAGLVAVRGGGFRAGAVGGWGGAAYRGGAVYRGGVGYGGAAYRGGAYRAGYATGGYGYGPFF